ncbi:MAG: BatA domain-containing protein, partial [Planctomycetota bacterium]|nr:BatA domain-containing protein [Planctomycetota bacterium]
MLALSFVNLGLLGGIGLASIPLIIHILNRRRYKVVQWAAMDFLLKAFKENRRRVRFEQLLLLLLRMVLVALLAFLLSRPKASSDELGGLLGRRIVHHVLLVDESGSMGESQGAGTSFGIARRFVVARLEAIAHTRPTDLVTLLRSSSEKPEIVARPVSLKLVADVKELLQHSTATPDRFRLPAVLDRVRQVLRSLEEGRKTDMTYLHLFSDLKAVDLTNDEGKLSDRILTGLRGLEPSKLLISRCGMTRSADLAVTSVNLRGAKCIRNQRAHFDVVVKNLGSTSSGEVEVGFTVDGRLRSARTVPSLAPNAEHIEAFRVRFTKAGSHWVEADLPRDRMPIDDRRALAVPVAQSAKALLVDGDPNDSEERAETFYLRIALDPTDDGSSGLAVTRIDENEVSGHEFSPFDVVALANVASLDDETVKRLSAFVQGGGGLLMFVGDQVEPDAWNHLFWRGGNGLLPAPLRELAGDMDNPDKVVLRPDPHPMFGDFQEELGRTLGFVNVGRYLSVGSEIDGVPEGNVPEGSEILMRLAHESGPPLWVEKPWGKGRVSLCLTTADVSWTPWASNPAYLIVARRAVDWMLRRDDLGPANCDARSAFRATFPAARYQGRVRLGPARDDPDADIERELTMTTTPAAPDTFVLEAAPNDAGRPWNTAGAMRLELETSDTTRENVFFTVSPWGLEGSPRTIAKRDLLEMLPKEIRDKTQFV